ncbi:MAG: hypothetical protein P1P87_04655 [Trueperaceae bacterium]|nr:hypothetical protein [Trueperaceae bacterium]
MALAVAADRAAHEPEAVAWVGLASARTGAHVAAAIAESLRQRLHGAVDPAAGLAHLLAPRRLLLVLDDIEHLVDPAPLLSGLLATAPGVTLLVTSRRALGVPEEWRFELAALPVPEVDAPDLTANDGVRLFLQAALRVAGPRAPTAADLPDVARVCRGVGGVPLALELAASWTRLLTPRRDRRGGSAASTSSTAAPSVTPSSPSHGWPTKRPR